MCYEKKQDFYSLVYVQQQFEQRESGHLLLSLPLIQVYFDSFLTAHWYSKFCYKSVSSHHSAALLWTAVVVAARRTIYSPTFLPASHFIIIIIIFRVLLSLYKLQFFSRRFVWFCYHISCMTVCACVRLSFPLVGVCDYVAGCVPLLQLVCGGVGKCVFWWDSSTFHCPLHLTAPPALKQHTLPPVLPLTWFWVNWGPLPWISMQLDAFYREDGSSVRQRLNMLSKSSEIRVS